MAKTILGTKVGMTQIFTEDGKLVPVTVIEAGPVTVTQVKTVESDGYSAVQIGFGDLKENRANKPLKGHFARWGAPLKKRLAEIRLDEGESYEAGQVITVEDFVVGSYLDVTGVSKGKGTQGNIKRHGHHRGPMTHGSKHKRLAGALAAGTYPSRVFKGNAGPGRMGRETVTVQNLELVGIVPERNAMLVKGATPGRRGGPLKIRYAVKKEAPAPVEAPAVQEADATAGASE
jgi:large subunit ribosomal protein L3